MRLLLTADLHRDATKLCWLLEDAPIHDAILIAGDLLDIFSDTGFDEQKSDILIWRQAVLMAGRSFAWCSGNHDFFHDINTPMRAASPSWMNPHAGTACFSLRLHERQFLSERSMNSKASKQVNQKPTKSSSKKARAAKRSRHRADRAVLAIAAGFEASRRSGKFPTVY